MASMFTEEKIQGLFGSLAAEDESVDRLKEYFFKTDVYDKIHNNLPLRILVAHKGIGKSAMFKISFLENQKENNLSLWVKPDDIYEFGKGDKNSDFIQLIRSWKSGLESLIAKLVMEEFSLGTDDDAVNLLSNKAVRAVDKILGFCKKAQELVDIDAVKKETAKQYLKNKKLIVFIDDLDRGWDGSKESITRVSALLSAVRDMSNDIPGLCFRISLRSDVYYLVRTSDESTDKIEGNVVWLSWTEHQLLVLLVKRVNSFLGNKLSEKRLTELPQAKLVEYLEPIMDTYFMGDGKWNNRRINYIILSLIRRRPRDLVNLCTMAARRANENNHDKIKTDDWETVFDSYSLDRLQDTINEHRYELPDVEPLLMGMKPNKKTRKTREAFTYSTTDLLAKIRGIMQRRQFRYSYGKVANEYELLTFLFKINFIVGRKTLSDGYIDRKYFEDNRYISSQFRDFGYDWEVHPAFRWALSPERRDIFSTMALPEYI